MSVKATVYPALFKSRYGCLKGRDWLRSIDANDRQAFIEIGMTYNLHGHLGGLARAAAPRDSRGRFIKATIQKEDK